mmetsp:Transcript_30016/g.44636  ORF Transcript_30016/g.44636 Transcript_30016/m.44636 type:complete len:118 (-) Transcript_30016:2-355(-)
MSPSPGTTKSKRITRPERFILTILFHLDKNCYTLPSWNTDIPTDNSTKKEKPSLSQFLQDSVKWKVVVCKVKTTGSHNIMTAISPFFHTFPPPASCMNHSCMTHSSILCWSFKHSSN